MISCHLNLLLKQELKTELEDLSIEVTVEMVVPSSNFLSLNLDKLGRLCFKLSNNSVLVLMKSYFVFPETKLHS